ILVDEQYEAEAIRIVRSLPGRDNSASVIQGGKALRDASRLKLPADSIVHVLEFTHAVARAYLIASYGNVVRVDSAATLRQTPRGVTADGMASGNYRMFRCDLPDTDLVFGAEARERALQAKRGELARLMQDRQDANERMQESQRLLEAIDLCGPLGYADAFARVLELHREIRRNEMLIAQLDVSAHQALDAQLAQLRQDEQALDAELAELNRRTGELNTRRAGIAKRIERLG